MRVFLLHWDDPVELSPGESTVGRDGSCTIPVPDDAISRRHLRLEVSARGVTVEDLGSTNGTQLNDAPLAGCTRVADGDVLQLGHGVFTVRILAEDDPQVGELAARCRPVARPAAAPSAPVRVQPTLATCVSCFGPMPDDGQPCPRCGPPAHETRERRRELRVLVSVPVRGESGSTRFSGLAYDVGLGGMFVACPSPASPAADCRVTWFPEGARPLSARGVVRHVVAPHGSPDGHPAGFGIQFTEIEEQAWEWIRGALDAEAGFYSESSSSL